MQVPAAGVERHRPSAVLLAGGQILDLAGSALRSADILIAADTLDTFFDPVRQLVYGAQSRARHA
jgi:hypothetical protein